MKNLKYIHKEISLIKKHFEEKAKISGEGFNIFNVLGLESAEVTLHSRFIAELISPHGSHGQGEVFLQLFLTEIGMTNFSCKDARVNIEVHIGNIDEDFQEGGRLDILIENPKELIVIENKVYNELGRKQLERYIEYANKCSKNGKVYLLTLFADNVKAKMDEVERITYENEILNWLENCLKETATIPALRESIAQYIWVVRKLTNQSLNSTMSKEILNIIKQNPEYAPSIEESYRTLMGLKRKIKESYIAKLNRLFQPVEMNLKNGLILKIYYKESTVEGLWFGYKLYKNNTNGKTIDDPLVSALRKVIQDSIVQMEVQPDLHISAYHFAWYTPKTPVPCEKMPIEKVIELDDDENLMNELVQKVADEGNKIKYALIDYVQGHELIE